MCSLAAPTLEPGRVLEPPKGQQLAVSICSHATSYMRGRGSEDQPATRCGAAGSGGRGPLHDCLSFGIHDTVVAALIDCPAPGFA